MPTCGSKSRMTAPDKPAKKKRTGTAPTCERKRKVSMRLALAILAMDERKQFGFQVNAKEIARRHNVTYGTLRDAYYHFKHGHIEMPIKPTPLEELNDRRGLYEKMRQLGLRMTALITNQLEDATLRAEKASGLSHVDAGNTDAERDYRQINKDVVFLARSLSGMISLTTQIDEGWSSHLDDATRRLKPHEPINPILPIGASKQTAMLNAGETQRALQALEIPMEVTAASHAGE